MDHKVFNDPLHNEIKVHPLLVAIIDTPEFQRLRRLKALGACCYVFPGAEHSRFEHSLGVAHLAKELLQSLCENAKEYKRELGVCDRDKFCVQIAALCHDLGAGPLSYVFDRYVKDCVPQSDEDQKQFGNARWRAVKVFEQMYEKNDLKKSFIRWMHPEEESPDLDNDLTFIKELILGRPLNGKEYKGRKKLFFYKIIGRDSIIDIHKWDYLARNSRGLNVACGLDPSIFRRFLQCIQVDKDEEVLMIRDKLHTDLCAMYFERQMLHRLQSNTYHIFNTALYNHWQAEPISAIAQCARWQLFGHILRLPALAAANKAMMAYYSKPGVGRLLDLLKSADDVTVYCVEKNPITLRQCVKSTNIAAFIYLDDTIVSTICREARGKTLSNSEKVLAMWTNLETRKLYQLGAIRDCPMEGRSPLDSALLLEELADCSDNADDKEWIRKNAIMHVASFDYGLRGQDPLKAAYFYKKGKPDERQLLTKEQLSKLLPRTCTEQQVFYYMRDVSKRPVVDRAFATWCTKKKEAKDKRDSEEPEELNTLPESCPAIKELKY